MDSNYERQAVILFGQDSAKMTVPCVTMHDIGVDIHGIEVRATPYSAESRSQWFWAREAICVQFEANHLQIAVLETLLTKAPHFDVHGFCKFLR